jgi:hypothetical protein
MAYNEGIRAYTAGEDLKAHRRVKIKTGTTTTPPEVVYADAGEQYIGVTEWAAKDGDLVSIRLRNYPGTVEIEAADTFSVAATLYGADHGKVSDTSSGSAIGIAHEACTGVGDIVEVATFAVLSTEAGNVSINDGGGFTSTATVEAALQEIYQHIASAQAYLNLPLGAWTEQDGTALADFANGDSPTPGWNAGDEGFGIRWNNHANPDPISTSVPIPPDLDDSADVIVHVLAAKVGATVGDAVKWTIEAFNNVDGAVYDADADFGGDSSAMTGDATTKTCQEETLTLAAADVAASPCVLTLTLQPKDGTLGTDDVILLGVWLEYTRKILT